MRYLLSVKPDQSLFCLPYNIQLKCLIDFYSG